MDVIISNRIGIDTYMTNVVGSNRNPDLSSLEIYRNGKLVSKQDLTFGQYGFRGSLVYDWKPTYRVIIRI